MKLISIKELSQFLNVKGSTLYAWVHNGTIPFYKLNGILRFDMEEIKEWVKSSRVIPCNVTISPKKSGCSDVDSIIKKAIDDITGKSYNPSKRETSLSQGLRKEV